MRRCPFFYFLKGNLKIILVYVRLILTIVQKDRRKSCPASGG